MRKVWIFVIVAFSLMIFLVFTFFFLLLAALLLSNPDVEVSGVGNVAVISLSGEIVGDRDADFFGSGAVSSQSLVRLIDGVGSDRSIKAVIIEVNSPGGSAVASEEIANAVKQLDKPVVAVIREYGTSGAYWVASSADRVFASRVSLTGSIGVTAAYLQFGGLLERYNVSYERMVAGKYKDMGSPYRELTDEERFRFQRELDLVHGEFIRAVAENRQLDEARVRELATGELFLGSEAVALALVDEIGGRQEASKYLESKLNVPVSLVEYRQRRSFFDSLGEVLGRGSFNVGRGIGHEISRQGGFRVVT
ncbi:signal peptide peptidase SppA [Candidatus Woesearchaeota archaeon]|nr:signal peptide peptidase SppA [Candidatus Woesearchaeota archaeon]